MQENHAISKSYLAAFLIVIIAISAIVRLYGLDRQSLWYDEVVEEAAFQKQFFHHGHYASKVIPNTPPLNSFIIFLVKRIFPSSDFAIRMVPFTFGLISVPLFFLLAKQIFNEKIGLIAAFLLAISPFHIWYSQDARMYALQWMLALTSMIYFLRALDRPTLGNYIGYVISTVAGLYTHQLSIFLALLQGLYVLISFRKSKAQYFRWLGAFCAIVILYVPWLILMFTSLMAKQAGFPKSIHILNIFYTIYAYCAGFSIGPSLRELHLDQSFSTVMPYFPIIISIISLYSILFVSGLLSLRRDLNKLLLLILLFTVPIIGVFVLTIFKQEVAYNVRYTGIAFFAFLLLIAKGIDFFRTLRSCTLGNILTVFVMISITGISAYSYKNYQFVIKYHKPDIRSTVAYISSEKITGDAALCLIDSSVINRYAKGSFQCSEFHINVVDNKERLNETMWKIVEGKKRLWLVLYNEWFKDNIDTVKAWLDTNYKEIKHLYKGLNDIANVRIYCYDLNNQRT